MKQSPAKAQRRKKTQINICVFAPLRETLIVTVLALFAFCALWNSLDSSSAQTQPSLPSTLGLDQGYLDLETGDFKLRLVKASQTVAALEPKNTPGFDFTPGDRLSQRAANRYHHLGDLILRVRTGSSGPWQKYDTAELRKPVEPLTPVGPTLAAADLAPTLPADIPLQVTRSWIVDNDRLVLRFEIKNKTAQPVQIGGARHCRWSSTTSLPAVTSKKHTKSAPLPILTSAKTPDTYR